jgi:hypothetical protein
MIKISLKELFQAEQALQKILAKEIPFKLAYRMTKISKKFVEESKIIEGHRLELIKKYGVEDKKTGQWSVAPDKIQAFREELDEVLNEVVELDIQLIPQKVIEAGGNISSLDMLALEKLIEPMEADGGIKGAE